jgi:hypothetical protein
MGNIAAAWGTVRASLLQLSFADIKTVAGLAGIDLMLLSHLQQRPDKGATKEQLMSGIEGLLGKMDVEARHRFVVWVAEELLVRKPELAPSLDDQLARHGWGLIDYHLIPLPLFDPRELMSLPDGPRADLVKAAQRFRDGDLGGAISAACGAVDTAVGDVYADYRLGEPAKSFQEGCNRALGAVVNLEGSLRELGWDAEGAGMLAKSFKGSLNQGAYVMQSLRSKMGDVHGTKPTLKPLVFDVLKWAELFVRTLTVR